MTITQDTSPIYKLRSFLPQSICQALSRLSKSALDRICEIRLHVDGCVGITIDGKNRFLTNSGISSTCVNSVTINQAEIDDFIYKFCKGSIYSHENTLSKFYVVNDGIRVGIGGEAITKNGSITGVSNISDLNIRIPHHVDGCSLFLMDYIREKGFGDGKGILVISSPGVGKTTLLRDLAIKLSDGKQTDSTFETKRVCVIDERKEIFMKRLFSGCCVDFLSGVSKLEGIEIASRVLSPQIIICDEIANPEEALKITERKNAGIVFISSMHSDSFENVLAKSYVKRMFDEGVFGAVCCLTRNSGIVTGTVTEYKDNG